MPSLPFPTYFDNTMREAAHVCGTKFRTSFLLNRRPKGRNVHLLAGGALAAGLEMARRSYFDVRDNPYRGDGAIARAKGWTALTRHYGDFTPPEGTSGDKSYENVAEAFDAYLDKWPFASDYIQPFIVDGLACVEFTFAIPLPEVLHPETGQPMLYTGRFDWLGLIGNDLYIVDEKTSAELGPKWSLKYEMSSQLTGYYWVARTFGFDVKGIIIRGIGLLKSQIKLDERRFYRQAWEVNRWYQQLIDDIENAIREWERDRWSFALGDACAAYGGCEYRTLCQSANPGPWLDVDYEERNWDPLNKGL